MTNEMTPKVRLVRCPRCRNLLQEPTDVPLYSCGGCGAILRVKNWKDDAGKTTVDLPNVQSSDQRSAGDRNLSSNDGTKQLQAVPGESKTSGLNQSLGTEKLSVVSDHSSHAYTQLEEEKEFKENGSAKSMETENRIVASSNDSKIITESRGGAGAEGGESDSNQSLIGDNQIIAIGDDLNDNVETGAQNSCFRQSLEIENQSVEMDSISNHHIVSEAEEKDGDGDGDQVEEEQEANSVGPKRSLETVATSSVFNTNVEPEQDGEENGAKEIGYKQSMETENGAGMDNISKPHFDSEEGKYGDGDGDGAGDHHDEVEAKNMDSNESMEAENRAIPMDNTADLNIEKEEQEAAKEKDGNQSLETEYGAGIDNISKPHFESEEEEEKDDGAGVGAGVSAGVSAGAGTGDNHDDEEKEEAKDVDSNQSMEVEHRTVPMDNIADLNIEKEEHEEAKESGCNQSLEAEDSFAVDNTLSFHTKETVKESTLSDIPTFLSPKQEEKFQDSNSFAIETSRNSETYLRNEYHDLKIRNVADSMMARSNELEVQSHIDINDPRQINAEERFAMLEEEMPYEETFLVNQTPDSVSEMLMIKGLDPARGSHPGRYRTRSNSDELAFRRWGPCYGEGPSNQTPEKFWYNSSGHSQQMSDFAPPQDKAELLRMVMELEEQVRRMCASGNYNSESYEVENSVDMSRYYFGTVSRPKSRFSQFQEPCYPHSSCSSSPRPQRYSSPSPSWNYETRSVDQMSQSKFSEVKYQRERVQVPKRHIRPVAGGSPVITCYRCLVVLQLPEDFLIFKRRRCYWLKCGSCSTVLRFSLQDGIHVVPSPQDAVDKENISRRKPEHSPESGNGKSEIEEVRRRKGSALHQLMGYSSVNQLVIGSGQSSPSDERSF